MEHQALVVTVVKLLQQSKGWRNNLSNAKSRQGSK